MMTPLLPNAATTITPSVVDEANAYAIRLMCDARPKLVDVRAAIEVVPGMKPNLILTSGAPLRWSNYSGGQRNGIIGAALFEGLVSDAAQVDSKIADGSIIVEPCQEHACIGS